MRLHSIVCLQYQWLRNVGIYCAEECSAAPSFMLKDSLNTTPSARYIPQAATAMLARSNCPDDVDRAKLRAIDPQS